MTVTTSLEDNYNNEYEVRKQRKGGRRDGIAKHSVKWTRQGFEDRRQVATVAKFTDSSLGDLDSMQNPSVQYSMNKKGRWQEIEQLKKSWGVVVCEERRRMPRKAAPFRKMTPKIVADFSMCLLVACLTSPERKFQRKKPEKRQERKQKAKVVKSRTGRVWRKDRTPGRKVETRPGSTSFPFMYLWGKHTLYVVLKATNQEQYNHLAALKSRLESRIQRNKQRASKKQQKQEFMEVMTSFKL